MNLLEETEAILTENGRSLGDIAWVGCHEFRISTDDFLKAADTEYDAGFGSPKVAEDLLVVLGDGSWLERNEYDGSEWWEFKGVPRTPERVWGGAVALTVNQVEGSRCGWESLASLCLLAERGQ